MKILVAVKRVIDYNVQIRVKDDNSGIVTENVKMSTNPPDDNAIEEAVKIKEAGKAAEIIAVSVGEEKAQETVRKALAVGEREGFIKTIFDGNTGELIGAHMIGSEVTELIHSYTLGKQLETTEEDLIDTVFPHPTLSEMLHESALNAFGKGIHF